MRSEIQNLSFTRKEIDIYRIHQSGDLVNLDGLEDSSFKLLPCLLVLRDALYSSRFRNYLSQITQAGPLSGKKTDMAINVYTPGCHLLCHDDVIGSRRVSYILYLTDPDTPWKEEWGGALRLYPTSHPIAEDLSFKVPLPDPIVSIPPAFNQLSFFAVQPGESFHDVEEVFASDDKTEDETRIRTAISGWYHIPQEGEDGYIEGLELETKMAEKSSLTQLQGKGDAYDLPSAKTQPMIVDASFSSSIGRDEDKPIDREEKKPADRAEEKPADQDEEIPADRIKEKPLAVIDSFLSEYDLNFLLKYIQPEYLVPDSLESVALCFTENCSLTLKNFLSEKFSDSLRDYIAIQESQVLPANTTEIESTTPWTVARPPHKHRFLFLQGRGKKNIKDQSPLQDLLENLLPSLPFHKWLQLATGQVISSHNLLARRFRRGKDYTLATHYDEEDPQLEITLAITPTSGWEAEGPSADQNDEADDQEHTDDDPGRTGGDPGHAGGDPGHAGEDPGHTSVGKERTGHEKEHTGGTQEHTNGDQEHASGDQEQASGDSEHASGDQEHKSGDIEHTSGGREHASGNKSYTAGEKQQVVGGNEPTGGDVGGYVAYLVSGEEDGKDDEDTVPTEGQTRRPRFDPAVYQAAGEDDEDLILVDMPAAWNRLDIVLRDTGVMRFVKYVSQRAQGDRWDICGEFSVVPPEDEEEEVTREGEAAGGDKAPDPTFPEDTDETEMKSESESESETSDDE